MHTPTDDGFRMPAEWAPHDGCYLIWPQRPDNWRDGGKPAQGSWVTLIETIADYEAVTVLVSADQYENARRRLSDRVRLIETSSDDAWVRDTGPSFLIDSTGQRSAVSWEFNAWGGTVGGLYRNWDRDTFVAAKIADIERAPVYEAGFVLEGGSIDVDGEGTVITTEECLLNPNRNPHLTKAEIEARLCKYLGVTKVIWLPRGVYMDETDGHTDNFARFVAPGVVVLTWTNDRADEQWERSSEALQILKTETDARGRELQVVTVHQPGPMYATEEEAAGVDLVSGSEDRSAGHRLAGSYVNFYVGNGFVVLPAFDDPHDTEAVETYQRLYPNHTIRTIPGREILLGGGNIHCITQQLPSVVTSRAG